MKIAILGYGQQNRSAYNYWRSSDNQITICDLAEKIEDLPSDVEVRNGEDYLDNLDGFDLLIRSPSVHPDQIVKANSPAILSKVTTVTNEFFRACPSKNVIGVTGTKGKGTTCTLVTKMLESAGKRVHLGGNIGIPPLEMLKADIGADDWVVIELANFQIIDLKYSPIIAVCLMVVPEHLNWHSDMEEYIKAKQQLFAHQLPKDTAIYLSGNEASVEIASVGQGKKIPYFKAPGALVKDNQIIIDGHTVCRTDEIKLLGQHNWQNVCAAVTAVWQINQNIDAIRSVVISFSGLEHRLEFVREVNGIKFYNDSFAATPDAGTAAIEAIHDPKVMIMGGFDRQLPLERFAKYISEHSTDIRKLLLIGESSERVSHELTRLGFNNYLLSPEKSMDNIVDQARTLAQNGDSVVLSPGFASFDMFKNFEERGQMYKSAVNKL